jgi:hypothetical protein
MTRKMSAFGALTGSGADRAADYIPIVDASVADASKNKIITLNEMVIALGLVVGTDVQGFDAQLSSLIRQNSKSAAYTTVLTDGGASISIIRPVIITPVLSPSIQMPMWPTPSAPRSRS